MPEIQVSPGVIVTSGQLGPSSSIRNRETQTGLDILRSSHMDRSVSNVRKQSFSQDWPLDEEVRAVAATTPTHAFLQNPSGHYAYIYLSRFVKALSESHFHRPFGDLSVLDWGCGKGHVSKIMRDLGPGRLDSCDILSEKDDSTFGQETPIIDKFGIHVKPLEHEYLLPYEDAAFDIVLSVGVLEHVSNDRASLAEIKRVLKPGGLFFCFFLPTRLSWTQKVAHIRGNDYHDRLYSRGNVRELTEALDLRLLDLWYRQLLPKNTAHYPNFRLFEKIDQFVTERTPLRYFATNVEFVCVKPNA
jgi:SAM-dependent methyltransferase